MNRVTAKLLLFVILLLVSSKTALAYDGTGSAVVSATILSTSFDPPILISPNDNSTTNNPRESLVWKRPLVLPVTPLHHYDVYLDDQVFAASVSDTITTQVYYFYTIRRVGDTFYLDMNSDFTQGTHTWKVVAYNTAGTSASSETRTFYIDSTVPYIKLEKVDRQILNWTTQDYSTIPGPNQRDLTVTHADPLLTGSVEPYANMQIILMCPQNILHCTNQVYQGNYPSGNWQHRFYGLIRGLIYTVYLSATDAGGNSVIFPEFYLAFGIKTPFPSAIITPVPTTPPGISPTVTPTLTPEPTPEIVTPFIPVPPAMPTPPIFLSATPATSPLIKPSLLLILFALGLPLHLFMAIYGSKIRFTHIFKFLFILFFPFIGKKEFQTVPFATLDLFDPEKLDSAWQTKISDVKGFYSLSSPILPKVFVKISATGRVWKNIIVNGEIFPITCLIPLLQDPKIPSNRLQKLSLSTRSLPLGLACLISAFSLITQPNYYFLIYLFLSLQLVFTEYLYPKLSK